MRAHSTMAASRQPHGHEVGLTLWVALSDIGIVFGSRHRKGRVFVTV